MLLQEKLDHFIRGHLHESSQKLITETIPEIANVDRPRFLANCLFESHVSVSSPVITNEKNVFVGHRSYMNDGGYIRGNVFIGRYCSIGRRVSIGAGSHPMQGLSTSPAIKSHGATAYTREQATSIGLNTNAKSNKGNAAPTVIMNDVWIGDGAVIVPGVTIATGAVIGANTVVTHDVEPYAVVGGIPDRLIKKRFSEDVIKALLETSWWEIPLQDLNTMPTGNVLEFIAACSRLSNQKTPSAEHSQTFSMA